VDLLTRSEAAAKVGSHVYYGGLLDRRAGTLNPMGYVRGLARAARSAGARIATGVTVTGIASDGDGWRLTTGRGTVTASRIVLATNAYTDALWPGLKDSITLIHYFQVATVPLGGRLTGILDERQGVWDTAPVMKSFRRDGSDRLIVGSMGQAMGRLSRRWAARQLARTFPDLGPVEFEAAWHGRIAMTPDHLPRIHRLAEGLYTPIGYNGRGIAPGTVFGRAMATLLTDGRVDDLPLPVTGVAPVARKRLTQGFYRAAFAVNQIVRSF
jgi:glycine/D-amino acid oxidase-like deaminating enzyme